MKSDLQIAQARPLPRASVRVSFVCAIVPLFCLMGCGSGPAAIPPVNVDIDDVVQQLLVEYDADKSGGLSQSDLAAQPALAECLSQFRRDKGDEISREQLTKRLQLLVFDPKNALVSTNFIVTRNSRPLANANVRLVPIPVLKDVLPRGTGVTDEFGTALISASRED
jgi:hypothetical protein